jgi:hypothetical protein
VLLTIACGAELVVPVAARLATSLGLVFTARCLVAALAEGVALRPRRLDGTVIACGLP